MGVVTETPMTETACPRCETLCVGGVVGGRKILLNRWTIPLAHADVLVIYRPSWVYAVMRTPNYMYASEYYPGIHGKAALIHACGDRKMHYG